MRYYVNIVFLQGDESGEALNILNEYGEREALEYLKQWDFNDYGGDDLQPESRAGVDDDMYEYGDYLLIYNTGLGYIGLEKIINVRETGI